MADISKIKLNNIDYDIKDLIARTIYNKKCYDISFSNIHEGDEIGGVINSLLEYYDCLYIPSGVYYIETSIILKSNKTIILNDKCVLLKKANTVFNMFSDITGLSNITIKGGTISCNRENQSTYTQMLVGTNCSNINFENIEIIGDTNINVYYSGTIHLTNSNNVRFIDCKVHDCGSENIYLINCSNSYFNNVYSYNSGSSAIATQGGTNTTIINCKVDNTLASGISMNDKYSKVLNCTVTNAQNGITMGHIDNVADHSIISNCIIKDITRGDGHGILADYLSYGTITNCYIENCIGTGIRVRGRFSKAENCTIKGSGDTRGHEAISVSDDNIVNGCYIYGCNNDGIHCVGDNVIISNNYIIGNDTSNGIYINKRTIVTGNKIRFYNVPVISNYGDCVITSNIMTDNISSMSTIGSDIVSNNKVL